MTLVKCRSCACRDGQKPITVFGAWRDASGARHARRTSLCVPCFAAKIAPLDVDAKSMDVLRCPNCGIETEADYDAQYLNTFIPGYGRRDIEAPFCGPCAAHWRIWFESVSDALEDRGRADQGPSPMTLASDTLRALGLRWIDAK